MKNLLIIAVMLISTISFSQNERKGKLSKDEQVEVQLKKMTTDLNLDTKQQKEVKAFLFEKADKREAKRAEIQARREAGKPRLSEEEREALKAELQNEKAHDKERLGKILSEDQMKKWDQIQTEKREEKKAHLREKRMSKK